MPKIIDGKKYTLGDSTRTKREAQASAQRFKDKYPYFSVRVMKATYSEVSHPQHKWVVWVRGSPPKR